MEKSADRTTSVDLLRLWARAGDRAALDELVQRHQRWLWGYVKHKLSAELRASASVGSEDVVQDALLGFFELRLRYLPESDGQLRGLLARIALNRIQAIAGRARTGARLGADSMLLSQAVMEHSSRAPSAVAAKDEEQRLLCMALEVIDAPKRLLIELHCLEGHSHAEIAAIDGVLERTAAKRVQRAVLDLGKVIRRIEAGQWAALGLEPEPHGPDA